MKITEVRIFPTESRDGKLKAFATMTFDDWFVVRNVKIIQGTNGLFVAMPSRKAMDSCSKCRTKNARGSKYCNECGSPLGAPKHQDDKRQGSHMDIAHPISQDCRVYIQEEILKAYEAEEATKAAADDTYKPATDADLSKAGEEPAKEEIKGEPAPKEEETKEEEVKEEPAKEEETKEEPASKEEEPVMPNPVVDETKDIEL